MEYKMKKLFSKVEFDNYINFVVLFNDCIEKFHTKKQAIKYCDDNGIKGFSILTKKQYNKLII